LIGHYELPEGLQWTFRDRPGACAWRDAFRDRGDDDEAGRLLTVLVQVNQIAHRHLI
jgi:hypothetical protein